MPRRRLALLLCGALALATFAGTAIRKGGDALVVATAITGGDPSRAPALLRRYGCAGCHTIPGVPGARGQVGGSLAGLRQRVYIAGVVPNDADNLVRWIVAPTALDPLTAMPVTGITEPEARDVAAWLYAR